MWKQTLFVYVIFFSIGILPVFGDYFDQEWLFSHKTEVFAKKKRKKTPVYYQPISDPFNNHYYKESFFENANQTHIQELRYRYNFHTLSSSLPQNSQLTTLDYFHTDYSARQPFEEITMYIVSGNLMKAPPDPTDPGNLPVANGIEILFWLCLIYACSKALKDKKI